MDGEKYTEQIAELNDQNAKLVEENAELKQKRPAVEVAELDASSSQKQMKLSSETSDDMDDTKMDTIGEKIPRKPKSVPNPNCLHDILAWIKRKEMAKSALSTSSRRFQKLCWPKLHGNVKPHFVEPLQFEAVEDERTELFIEKSKLRIRIPTPIASIPPPSYIIGFQEISFLTLNDKVMKFMECVIPILNEFHLDFHPYFCKLTNNVDRLLDMLAKKIFSISLSHTPSLQAFVHYRPNANAILENVQEIRTEMEEENMDLLFNWLAKSRADKKPKILKLPSYQFPSQPTFFNRIKEQFSRATNSTNFLIVFERMDGPYFVIENEQTNEVLSYSYESIGDMERKILVRFPKGKEHLKEEWKQIKSQSKILMQ